ncbi:hypothetical protein CPter91_2888 [Collimonas pratensis]|uniref:Uncharacterized protein n=1 Tax=Collimonas pratensis TaxID=279113 RepID=A0A127Q5C2_9BURK|nr:hypothetical protein CPter91_2888 [Collimonas pratensis]
MAGGISGDPDLDVGTKASVASAQAIATPVGLTLKKIP